MIKNKFQAIQWLYEDETDVETGECKSVIYLSGINPEQKKVQCKILEFRPYVYMSLPDKIKWTNTKFKLLFSHFQENSNMDNEPLTFSPKIKEKLYGRERVKVLALSFKNNKACHNFNRKISYMKSLFISGVGRFRKGDFKVYEHNIDPIIKFTASKKIKNSGWVETKSNSKIEKFSSADVNICVHTKNIYPIDHPNGIIVKPVYLSFDIECYSHNHNSKLPVAEDLKNKIFQISCVFGKIHGDISDKYLLSLFNPNDIPDVKILRCKSEKELLVEFCNLILKYDVDVFIGYNIMKFDWGYILSRAKIIGCLNKILKLTRLSGKKAEIAKISWSSSAYGNQVFSYPVFHGRVNMDILLEVERNYKLPSNTLNNASKYFLKDEKDDISARQLFILYQITDETYWVMERKTLKKSDILNLKRLVAEILPDRFALHGEVKNWKYKFLNCKPKEIKYLLRECLTLTGKYCVQDTILPIKLYEKLNLWSSMEQMSNVMKVPISFLHTRGQQIKVISQVYSETLSNNIIVPPNTNKDDTTKFQGAIVIEAVPGFYQNVPTLDFASLYPTIIISYNICYTTFINENGPDKNYPDEKCHIIAWDEHIRCKHDPLNRKAGKNDTVLCGHHRYRFKKIEIDFDDDGNIIRKNEGLIVRLERNLLSTRKEIKKEMFKVEARLAMQKGHATKEDIENYRKYNYEIISKGELCKEEEILCEVTRGVLNAQQLAVKVSCNSVSEDTNIPIKISRKKKFVKISDLFREYSEMYNSKKITVVDQNSNSENEILNLECNGDSHELQNIEIPKVWTDQGWSKIKKIIRHPVREPLNKISTGTSFVEVTDGHSLLDSEGNVITAKEIQKNLNSKSGVSLLHHPIELPNDTPKNYCLHNHLEFDWNRKYLNFGKTNDKKYLSKVINKNYTKRRSYVQGMFGNFGHEDISSKTVMYGSTNQTSVSEILYLLRSVGLKCIVETDVEGCTENTENSLNNSEQYNIFLTDL